MSQIFVYSSVVHTTSTKCTVFNKLKWNFQANSIQNLSICFHQYIKLKTEMRATITTATTSTTKTTEKKTQFHSICTIVKQLIVSSSNCVYFIRFNFRRHRTLFFSHTCTMCHATLPPQVQT